jgi:hypothetical protein
VFEGVAVADCVTVGVAVDVGVEVGIAVAVGAAVSVAVGAEVGSAVTVSVADGSTATAVGVGAGPHAANNRRHRPMEIPVSGTDFIVMCSYVYRADDAVSYVEVLSP